MKKAFLSLLLLVGPAARGNVLTAASCNLADIQQQIDKAKPEDTVNIPTGLCSWKSSKLELTKPLTLNAAGVELTRIEVLDLDEKAPFRITGQWKGVVHLQNMSFTEITATNRHLPVAILSRDLVVGVVPDKEFDSLSDPEQRDRRALVLVRRRNPAEVVLPALTQREDVNVCAAQ
jgi:hypothetical protein